MFVLYAKVSFYRYCYSEENKEPNVEDEEESDSEEER